MSRRDAQQGVGFVLLVSGLPVALAAPTGAENVLLVERRADDAGSPWR